MCRAVRLDDEGVSAVEEVSIGEFARRSRLSMLRRLDWPLAAIRELLACDPVDAAERIAAHWREVESVHDARREQGAWALGKEFIAVLRERPLPKMEGREGAMFTIYWGEVSADSDGPVEMCKPVPESDAQALASHYPELTLRTEPAHREAYVALPNDALPAGPGGGPGVQWQLASEALRAWADEQGIKDENLALKVEDLGMRVTYLASGSVTETSAPYCDFALPFA
jgi:hypothetical protein